MDKKYSFNSFFEAKEYLDEKLIENGYFLVGKNITTEQIKLLI